VAPVRHKNRCIVRGKIRQKGFLKLNFEILQKKRIFRKILQAIDEVEIFFAIFQIPGKLGCQGWVVMTKNVKKKTKSLCPIE
jgi:hypothetical protein